MTPLGDPDSTVPAELPVDATGSDVAPHLRLIASGSAAPSDSSTTSAKTVKDALPRRAPDDTRVHRLDRPSFCPSCGSPYAKSIAGIVVEYWTSHSRVFHCWCSSCDQAFDIADANQVITEEIEH
jgi:hypothetical protein